MKKYRYNGKIEKFIYQNAGTVIDIIEGVLLDSYLIDGRRGYIAVIDTFVNTNMSNYTVYFDTNPDAVLAIWDKIKAVRTAD